MDNIIYQGMVITIQAVVSVFDFFYFFLAQTKARVLSWRIAKRKKKNRICHSQIQLGM